MVDIDDICGHAEPAWKAEGDTFLMCDLGGSGLPGRWEQLWAKRTGTDEFVVCAIPLFADGIALGDHVTARPAHGFDLVVDSVVRSAGNAVLRVYFREGAEVWETQDRQTELIRSVGELGLLSETGLLGHVAISCPWDSPQYGELEKLLHAYTLLEWSDYESGTRR
ncbi:DUF4265 domain-containing protein [Streptomyces sp. NPDC049879]|uniref:DUF4265 domain-containing protein n=1 Tax=Streptomyces sp. NPDC049879 TaxID=3365598 RepID=UPI00378B9CE3